MLIHMAYSQSIQEHKCIHIYIYIFTYAHNNKAKFSGFIFKQQNPLNRIQPGALYSIRPQSPVPFKVNDPEHNVGRLLSF